MMKGKNLQPRLLYPARISFRFDREIKTFTDKQKLRKFMILVGQWLALEGPWLRAGR